jgi:hypothetical protein
MKWISVEDRLPESEIEKYLAKKENCEIFEVFFMPDKMGWISFYGQKTTYWMETSSGNLLYNITHWTKKPPKIVI